MADRSNLPAPLRQRNEFVYVSRVLGKMHEIILELVESIVNGIDLMELIQF